MHYFAANYKSKLIKPKINKNYWQEQIINRCLQHWLPELFEQSTALLRTLFAVLGSVYTTRNGRFGSFLMSTSVLKTWIFQLRQQLQSTKSLRLSLLDSVNQVRTVSVKSIFCHPGFDSSSVRVTGGEVLSLNS